MTPATSLPQTEATRTARSIEFDIGGMSCASCAHRIERKLGKLPGVQASVNFATERAQVQAPPAVSTDQLVATIAAAGYTATEHREQKPERTQAIPVRLVVSALLSVCVALVSMVPALQFPGWEWASLALATPVVFWAAWPIHRGSVTALLHGGATMDTLVSVGIAVSYLWSTWMLLSGTGQHLYFEVAAVVTVLVLLGRWFEDRAKTDARRSLTSLGELAAKTVTVVGPAGTRSIPIAQLHVGDTFLVRPGEKIATDGEVLEGSSQVDASLITGESAPVSVAPGDDVTGATINGYGTLTVRATQVGSGTELARLARMVEQAQSGKAQYQRLADRISAVFVPVVVGLAVFTFAGWMLAGASVTAAINAAVATLIIACPCALGLATPTALLVGTGRGAQLGIIIRGPEALERAPKVTAVVLDKTGTVTTGRMSVARVLALPGASEATLRTVVASVERSSEHPIARALGSLVPPDSGVPVAGLTAVPGAGVQCTADGRATCVGRLDWVAEHAGPVPAEVSSAAAALAGATAVGVAWDGQWRGLILLSDEPRPDAADAVAALLQMGVHPVLASGDHLEVAEAVARRVGIPEVHAPLRPDEKVAVVRRLQDEGHQVAMLGDGVNDAAALAASDLGMAMGSGTDAAVSAAEIVLVRRGLAAGVDALRLARRTMATIRGNLFWAFAYNVVAIPAAMLGVLNPMVAAAAMGFSSIFVVGNSLRLRRFR